MEKTTTTQEKVLAFVRTQRKQIAPNRMGPYERDELERSQDIMVAGAREQLGNYPDQTRKLVGLNIRATERLEDWLERITAALIMIKPEVAELFKTGETDRNNS